MAALKLSEKLLNAYWLLLLVLIFGDVVIGAFWAYRFEKICQVRHSENGSCQLKALQIVVVSKKTHPWILGNRISLILSIANPERKARDLCNTLASSKMCLDKSPFPQKGTKRSRVNVASFMNQFPFSFFVPYAKGTVDQTTPISFYGMVK